MDGEKGNGRGSKISMPGKDLQNPGTPLQKKKFQMEHPPQPACEHHVAFRKSAKKGSVTETLVVSFHFIQKHSEECIE